MSQDDSIGEREERTSVLLVKALNIYALNAEFSSSC